MGSGVGVASPVVACCAEPFIPPPPRDGVVPTRIIHELHVVELEDYLVTSQCGTPPRRFPPEGREAP